MDNEDIRHLLHSAYDANSLVPRVSTRALEQRTQRPRHRRIVASLVAVVAALAVALPVGVGLLLRTGSGGGSPVSTRSVLDLHMYNSTTGWAWAGGDEILHTTSGVRHWTIVPPPIGRGAIVEVAWVNAETARILTTSAGAVGNVERTYTLIGWMTNDGGATWIAGQPFTVLLETAQDPTTTSDLDFVDADHGWFFNAQNSAVGSPIFIFRTVDGGLHWNQVAMTPAHGTALRGELPVGCAAYGLTFVDATTGWVAGQCGFGTLFYVTHDGGTEWSPQPIACVNCALYPPRFISSVNGHLFGQNGEGLLFATSDGGETWSARAQPPGNWPDFVDAKYGFTLGLTGNDNPSVILWTTRDGGASWRQVPNGAIHGNGPVESSQLDFITPQIGWAVSVDIRGQPLLQAGDTPLPGVPDELWQTSDGGATWSQVMPTFTTSR